MIVLFVLSGASVYAAKKNVNIYTWYRENILGIVDQVTVVRPAATKPIPPPAPAEEQKEAPPPAPEAKKQIAVKPPVQKPSGETIVGQTTTNPDGSTTTVVSESSVSQSDVARVAANTNTPNTPYAIKFSDETGTNSALESILKDYLNNTLRWSATEIGSMKEIIVRDAGATGWSGQYVGSYTMSSGGDITEVTGGIILNTNYYKTSDLFNDYMKLVLSHEYGHHYTQYYKWVVGDIPAGERFPDSYYEIRPLSKADTAADYSLGWEDCDSEIIAEDYSYLYSGYSYHAMESARGLPSNPGTKNWLDDIASNVKAAAPVDNPPTVSLSEPANASTLSGQVTVKAAASDDRQVSKVEFYLDDSLVSTDTSSPYEVSWDTASATNRSYNLKVIAYDSANQTASSEISVIVSNTPPVAQTESSTSASSTPPATSSVADTEAPTVIFAQPATNPFLWADGDLPLEFSGADNIAVTKVEIYSGTQLLTSKDASSLSGYIRNSPSIKSGDYIFTAKAYDAAGNVGETSITVTKP